MTRTSSRTGNAISTASATPADAGSARQPVPNASAPPATKSGRQRTLTLKQQQTAAEHAEKANAAQKRAYTEALRAQQRREEINGFRKEKNSFDDVDVDDSLGPESEDEDVVHDTPFSSVTIAPRPTSKTAAMPAHDNITNPVIVTDPRTPGTPAHIVQDMPPAAPATTRKPGPVLIRRFTGPGKKQTTPAHYPVMSQSNAGPREAVHAGPYTPRIQAMYGRPDGSFYTSHARVPEAEASDDEFGTTPAGPHYEQPIIDEYPNAHPDLENFPWYSHKPADQDRATPQPVPQPALNKLVRKEAPATTSAALTVVTKCAKIEGSSSRNRIRASDFDDLSKSLIEGAISVYKAQIGAVTPFPERTEDRNAIKSAWIEVCGERGVRVELEEAVFKLITARASQTRGQLKTISKPYVLQSYNLDGSKRDIRDRVEHLLEGARFIYKDPEAKTGIFRAAIFQVLINKMWFRHKDDEGVIHPEFSEDDALAFPTLALVFTIVENNLDEWVTGEHSDVPFTTAAYKAKYRAHLKRLTDFAHKTEEAEIMPRLCKHMLKAARKHARVEGATGAGPASELADAEIEAAKKEWEDLVLSDDE